MLTERDIQKFSLVLGLTLLPLSSFLSLAFPQWLLTRNFWTADQQRTFDESALRLQLFAPHKDLQKSLISFTDPPNWPQEGNSENSVLSTHDDEIATSRSTLNDVLIQVGLCYLQFACEGLSLWERMITLIDACI